MSVNNRFIINSPIILNLSISLFLLTGQISTTTNNDCAQVCGESDKCMALCGQQLDPLVTSDLSASHCGLTRYDDNEANVEEAGDPTKTRIWNSFDADERQYPWTVSLQTVALLRKNKYLEKLMDWLFPQYNKTQHQCGGVLIHPLYVLTAAHCGKPYAGRLVYGVNDKWDQRFVVKVDKYIRHPYHVKALRTTWDKFGRHAIDYDIALVRLKEPINATTDGKRFIVNTICLPRSGLQPIGQYTRLSGWGDIVNGSDPAMLQHAQYVILDVQQCNTMVNETEWLYENFTVPPEIRRLDSIEKQQLIAGFVSNSNASLMICTMASTPPGLGYVIYSNIFAPGDSGSSLQQIYGQRAHTIAVVSARPNPQFNLPITYYSKVSAHMDWIKSVIENDN